MKLFDNWQQYCRERYKRTHRSRRKLQVEWNCPVGDNSITYYTAAATAATTTITFNNNNNNNVLHTSPVICAAR